MCLSANAPAADSARRVSQRLRWRLPPLVESGSLRSASRWPESARHPRSAVDLVVSLEGFERAQVALDFGRSGAPMRWPGGAAEGERESASAGTVAASLGGI